MAFPNEGSLDTTNQNPGDAVTTSYKEKFGKDSLSSIIERNSNMGRSYFLGPTARSLFYQGAKNSGVSGKYAQYLFYGTLGGENDFINSYYLSERTEFSRKISSLASKNPSSKYLVSGENVIGGDSAPYNWSDFLFCKYYGRIPNNYMITLRRYATPMQDNLSLPDSVKDSSLYELDGVGKPVAQAVTWFGGDTDNSLSSILGFSAGINFTPREQSETLNQVGMDKGFESSLLGRLISDAESSVTSEADSPFTDALIAVASLIQGVTDEGEANITDAFLQYQLRESASQPDGPLSDFIYVNVDTVDKMMVRERGLSFDQEDISINFHYNLSSLGEVNSKASFMDLFANLLSIGTNYGSFLKPDYRYDNNFPAIGFPGGEEGLIAFYNSPLTFFKEFISNGSLSEEALNEAQAQSREIGINDSSQIAGMGDFLNLVGMDEETDPNVLEAADRAFKLVFREDYIKNIQMNQSFLTGAPTGEWHLVVGNPMNPIAMVGNLVCTSMKISFGEKLGPDDFPTEILATYNLRHARDRDKGEIESMFNRGQGRLYQSTIKTSANMQSFVSRATIDGVQTENSQIETTEAYLGRAEQE